jgi:hypothetical protein
MYIAFRICYLHRVSPSRELLGTGSLALRQATPPRLRYHCKGPMERSARQSCGAVVSQHVFVRPDVTVQPIVPRVPAQTVQTLVKNNRAQKQLNWTRQEDYKYRRTLADSRLTNVLDSYYWCYLRHFVNAIWLLRSSRHSSRTSR